MCRRSVRALCPRRKEPARRSSGVSRASTSEARGPSRRTTAQASDWSLSAAWRARPGSGTGPISRIVRRPNQIARAPSRPVARLADGSRHAVRGAQRLGKGRIPVAIGADRRHRARVDLGGALRSRLQRQQPRAGRLGDQSSHGSGLPSDRIAPGPVPRRARPPRAGDRPCAQPRRGARARSAGTPDQESARRSARTRRM